MEVASCMNYSSKNEDVGNEVFVFARFAAFGNMFLLFLMLLLGLKLLRLGFIQNGLVNVMDECGEKSNDLRIGVWSGIDVCCIFYPKISSFRTSCSKLLSYSIFDSENISDTVEDLEEEFEGGVEPVEVGDDYEDENEEEMDAPALRKAIRIAREQVNTAYLELEKERLSASTAAKEALAMILRLQNDLSSIKLEADQYRKLAEQKKLHDHQVIEHLRWIMLENDSQKSFLESQLNLCRQKLMADDEEDEEGLEGVDCKVHETSSDFGDDIEDQLVSSLDMDLLSSNTAKRRGKRYTQVGF